MDRVRRVVGRFAVLAALVAGVVVVQASPAAAATRFVACNEGESLQAALDASADGDVIFVSGTCVGRFSIRTDVTVTGFIVLPTLQGLASSGQLGSVVVIENGANVTLQRLKVTGGQAFTIAHSGGVDLASGSLLMREVEVYGNHSSTGGGLSVFTNTSAVVEDSSIHDNEANSSGGGIFVNGSLTLRRSTVRDNEAEAGGGIFTGGSTVVVEDSLIDSNFALYHGGGIWSGGSTQVLRSVVRGNTGGLFNAGTMTVDRSAIISNDAGYDPSWGIGGGVANRDDGNVTIRTSTIADNRARTGGGVHNRGIALLEAVTVSDNLATTPVFTPTAGGVWNSGSFAIRSTVVSGNDGGPNPECSNSTPLQSNGSNFAAAACLSSPAGTDRLGSDPGLGTLASNGGPTPTLRPAAGSPVIDSGACVASIDQRGVGRPAGAACDVGAYENRVPASPSGLQFSAGTSPSTGSFALRWTGSSDPDGDSVAYRVERKDADDATYTPVTTVTTTSASLTSQPEGTQQYRVVTTDGNNDSGGAAGPLQVVVDRTGPAAPALTTDRDADHAAAGADWFADSVDVTVTPGADPLLPDGSAGSGTVGTVTRQTFSVAGPHTVTATSTDAVGNVSGGASLTVHVDSADPTVAFDTCPTSVLLGSSASAPWSAGDPGTSATSSGLAGDATGAAVLPASAVGPASVTVTVEDNVGHQASATCRYQVIYDFRGFDAPLGAPEPGLNEVGAGKLIPVRFGLSGDQGLGVLASDSPTWTPVACDTLAELAPSAPAVAARALEYDARRDLYTYSWQTSKDWKKACARLDLTLIDGTTHPVYLRFK